MKNNKLKLVLGLMCGLLLVPFTGEASTAVQLNETTALFTIDFTVSDELFTNEVPIAAKYGVQYLDRVDMAGYTIESSVAGAPAIKEINALVLSTNQISDTHYLVPKGTETVFQLFILATFAEPIEADYRARITKLPYYVGEKRTSVHQNQLDEFDMPVLKAAQ